MSQTPHTAMVTFRVCLLEVPLAAVNTFVLTDRVYAPRVGALHAHQLAMTTRIAWILLLGLAVSHYARELGPVSLVDMGLLWATFWLVLEWTGSLLVHQPMHQILLSRHLEQGYMWPYVLLAYVVSPSLAGGVTRWAGRPRLPMVDLRKEPPDRPDVPKVLGVVGDRTNPS